MLQAAVLEGPTLSWNFMSVTLHCDVTDLAEISRLSVDNPILQPL